MLRTVAGVGPVDVLVNCAGGVRGQVARPVEEVPEDDWRVIFQANVDAAFHCAQAVAPGMKAAGWGRIVNISSGAGLRRALAEAGCEKLEPLKKFPGLIREGRVPFVLHGLTFELLCQHTRAAAALPPQAEAARNVMKFTRESVCIIDGVPVLDIDAIVVWQALFDRPKDRATIEEVVKHKRVNGKPAIQDRDNVLDLVIANKSKHHDVVTFLQHTLWNPWHGSYR